MPRKGECRKIKRSTCAIPIQASVICNILPRQGVSNGLGIVKLKWGLKWSGHLYFESVCPHIIYQAIAYLKSHNKFYEDIPVIEGLSSEDMLTFSDINDEIQGENDTDYETEYASVEDLLNMNRTVTNEATLISGIPNIINEKHFQI